MSVLVVGDLRLDPRRHRVTRSGRPLELGTREFLVLASLMRHPGQPVSRIAIFEEVWPAGVAASHSLVDVYIRHLRSKIDDHAPKKLIQTIRGIGYMLKSD